MEMINIFVGISILFGFIDLMKHKPPPTVLSIFAFIHIANGSGKREGEKERAKIPTNPFDEA